MYVIYMAAKTAEYECSRRMHLPICTLEFVSQEDIFSVTETEGDIVLYVVQPQPQSRFGLPRHKSNPIGCQESAILNCFQNKHARRVVSEG